MPGTDGTGPYGNFRNCRGRRFYQRGRFSNQADFLKEELKAVEREKKLLEAEMEKLKNAET